MLNCIYREIVSNELDLKVTLDFLHDSLRILAIFIYHATFSSSYELL